MIAPVWFFPGSLIGSRELVSEFRVLLIDPLGLSSVRASLLVKSLSSANLHIGSCVLEVMFTARMATTIPPIMSTNQWIPRYIIATEVRAMKMMRKNRNLFHLPSSSHLCIVSQIANGSPMCRLGIPFVNGSILLNQL